MLLPEDINNFNIILASNSPRRKKLLSGLNLNFSTVSYETDECFPTNLEVTDIPVFLSEKKADNYPEPLKKDDILITADTLVIKNDIIFGKPESREIAEKMLSELSGGIHHVITGVTIKNMHHKHSFSSITEVEFDNLTERAVDYYIEKYKPYDKAGSYGIQEWIGYIGIKRINGCFYNVMGLPINKLYGELEYFIKNLS
ncbi:MAG: Maf family nucleotide pyrophosphatase [Rikenellaceae bacterium]|nr:Maf family nucleotide pyrophosphatase [Rikenellaceae bacterium]